MPRCATCSSVIPDDSRFCSECGAPASAGSIQGDAVSPESPTVADAPRTPPTSTSADNVRFVPGAVIADRYRIVGLLGKGGMGEVYRADDLKLGQPVALKFLPEGFETDHDRRQRFFNEVRVALKVSHPNVCRVYDIGELDGLPYISMEYVDGENMASLLRRIGRLPADKAVQIARQLCAGLAAAHEQGVLHRDLKPANVMIDGRGQTKITDFGLAGLERELTGDVRAGTPAYMAPEQLAGKEVTALSDIYSLGLTLYEVLTGKPAIEARTPAEAAQAHQSTTPTNPSTWVPDMDPAVEMVILRCLAKNPSDRPTSALAVSAALPGGDPLAAALAAGETPSPELVADAHASTGFKPLVSGTLLAVTLACLIFLVVLSGRSQLVRLAPVNKSPVVLADRAQEVIRSAGYTESPLDQVHRFDRNGGYLTHIEKTDDAVERWEVIRNAQPPAVLFRYRQSPTYLVKNQGGGLGGDFTDPPPTFPGMVHVDLDTEGRLRYFWAIPPDTLSAASSLEIDWQPMFAAAGLDLTQFSPVDPRWTPRSHSDHHVAWEGTYPDAPDIQIRIEAASFDGLPTNFAVIEPWLKPRTATPPERDFWTHVGQLVNTGWFVIVLLAGGFVALRNVRLRRGDKKGAIRLALYLGCVRFVWILAAEHMPTQNELGIFIGHLAWSAWRVCLIYVFYLAVEPYARRLWPRMLVSWVRLFNGRFRDPLVGRDILVGALFGVSFALVIRVTEWISTLFGVASGAPDSGFWGWIALKGARYTIAAFAGIHASAVVNCFLVIVFLLVLRLIFRKTWIAVTIASVIIFLSTGGNSDAGSQVGFIIGIACILAGVWYVIFRVGFLSLVVGLTIGDIAQNIPLTFELSSWYSNASLLVLFVVVGLSVYGCWVSLAGKPILRDEIELPGVADAAS